MPRVDFIQVRNGTAAAWALASGQILGAGEIGAENDTGRTKSGDGVRTWAALPYADDATRALAVQVATRGVANGVATLGANSKVTPAQLATAVPNGLATLDATGKMPIGQLPAASAMAVAYATLTNDVAWDTGLQLLITAPAIIGDGVKAFKISAFIPWMDGMNPGEIAVLMVGRPGPVYPARQRRKAPPVEVAPPGGLLGTAANSFFGVDVPPVGSIVYTLTLSRAAGATGGPWVIANATDPAWLLIEQIS